MSDNQLANDFQRSLCVPALKEMNMFLQLCQSIVSVLQVDIYSCWTYRFQKSLKSHAYHTSSSAVV